MKNGYGSFSHQIFVGTKYRVKSQNDSLVQLQHSLDDYSKYHVGYFSYELKNEIEKLTSRNHNTVSVNHVEFFRPEIIIKFTNDRIIIESEISPDAVWDEIKSTDIFPYENPNYKPNIQCRTNREQYLKNCKKIKQDIINGEYYEINYCIEYYADNCDINPLQKYLQLNELSPMPFSCLAKFEEKYVLCASPERFIRKKENRLISQPIKGTIRRGKNDAEDQQLKTLLRTSQKELAENMMIIDLVRNDLSKCSNPGTVKVDEFFGIYTFKQVHQMVSTISSELKNNITVSQIIQNTFPMGSMTGAPKFRVMKAIEEYEDSQRGIYSGSIGYITPDGDFDFNVVIRSIIYDQKNKKLSFHVGSAITYDADPEYEYEECLLKAKSMMEILKQ